MSDIFISYARSTEGQAKQIAEALRGLGYGVWRDDELPAHRSFAEVIEERLRAAKAVVVIWSAEGVKSEWVQAEADRARMEHKLVQLTVDGALPPIPFDRIQCADLAGWTGDPAHAGWRKVLASVNELANASQTTPAAAAAVTPSIPGARGNLPRRLGQIIGREAELTQIAALLEESDLVTVTGTGGVGKTRLVVEVGLASAEQFRDGAWLAELAAISEPEHVPGAVARAMNLNIAGADDAQIALVEQLKVRECLVILDNCEHLIDAVASLAEAILARSTNVKLLASSQELLGVEGERVYRLRSLDEAASVRLFAERAEAVDAGFQPARSDEASVAAICRRLDGIPLAIEMAAARAPALGCAELLERLDDRFRLLTGGRRTALPRQRTLLATLDWSHDLLSDRDAAVFRRLGVFSGGFTLDSAAEVCSDQRWDTLDVTEAVTSLVAKSLVATDSPWGGRRFRLLETTRSYALDRLAAAGETHDVQRAHADYFRRLAAECAEDFWLRPVSDRAFAERYYGEVDNFERAIEWAFGPGGDPQVGIGVASDAMALMWARSLYGQHASWAEQAVSHLGPDTTPAARARLLASRAYIQNWISPPRAVELADEAVKACRADGDPFSLYTALAARYAGLLDSERFEEAEAMAPMFGAMADQIPSPSRASAFIEARGAAAAFIEARGSGGATAPGNFDAAIATLRSIGAEGMAIVYRAFQLLAFPPGDLDVELDAWRTMLAEERAAYAVADTMVPLIAGRLMTLLANRGRPADLEEAMELGRQYAHLDLRFEGMMTLVGLGWVALGSGRANVAGRIAGRLQRLIPLLGNARFLSAIDDLMAALKAELPAAKLETLMAEGRNLSAEDARRLVLMD